MIDVTDFGAVGNGTTDDSEAIQNAIDATPQYRGGVIYFPQPTKAYRIASEIAVDRPSLVVIGEGKPGQNESIYHGHYGTAILCDGAGFVFEQSGLQHCGPRIQDLGFIADDDTTTLISIRDHNCSIIRDCVFRSGKIGVELLKDEVVQYGDNSWNLIDNGSFLNQAEAGVHDEGYGTETRGGKFLCDGGGVYIAEKAQHARVSNAMFDSGIGVECHGGACTVENGKFERCDIGVLIDGDDTTWPMSGRGNRIFGGTYSGQGNETGIKITSGGRYTRIIAPHYVWLGTTLDDNGTDTQAWG